jgi:hypothetical protein
MKITVLRQDDAGQAAETVHHSLLFGALLVASV